MENRPQMVAGILKVHNHWKSIYEEWMTLVSSISGMIQPLILLTYSYHGPFFQSIIPPPPVAVHPPKSTASPEPALLPTWITATPKVSLLSHVVDHA
jgi:hypothetical protein